MSKIPGFIPGDKVKEYEGVLAAKKGAVGYLPGVKKEEPQPPAKPKKAKE